jgi:hypothetical protein
MGEAPMDLEALREMTRAQGHQMFAGRLVKRNLTRPQRAALTVFRGLEGDFRDWNEIERWASRIANSLQSHATAPELVGARRARRLARGGGAPPGVGGDLDLPR